MHAHSYRRLTLLLFLLILIPAAQAAPVPNSSTDQADIHAVLDAQVTAWNRGDIAAFMKGYKNSDSTTFVGKNIQHGYAKILERYRTTFTTKDKMGQLTFTDLEITPLDARFATVTGRFHLARTAAAGGDAQGIFSLVFEKTAAGWKVILDHTS